MNLRELLRSGGPLHIGLLSVELPQDDIPRKAAGQGWDMALVDLQHGPYEETRLIAFLAAARAAGVPILLRAPHPAAVWQLGRLLDFGAAGVLVPMVETPETVREAVANVYYPPVGNRSCGLRWAYGYGPGQSPAEYAAWWNANGILAIQIESAQAALRIRDLLPPEVHLVLFGAVDLSLNLAANPGSPFAAIEDLQQHVVERTRDLDVRIAVGNMPYGRF
ncbi:MAG: hypothetical protein JXR77_12955 [Lentisphaeria bacterium]|nr:hypothetical protein [Lentisphaeria bacterium]